MAVELSRERIHELNVILYLRELKKQADSGHHMRVQDVHEWVTNSYNRYLYIHEHPFVLLDTIKLILDYKDIERWEHVYYLKYLGISPGETALQLGLPKRSVYNYLAKKDQKQNKNTLQRWLNKYEVGHDMHSLRETTEVSRLIVPPRKLTSVLFESWGLHS